MISIIAVDRWHGEEQENLIVMTERGDFFQFAVDITNGGECRLQNENRLTDVDVDEVNAQYVK